jgi:hypothetical protein
LLRIAALRQRQLASPFSNGSPRVPPVGEKLNAEESAAIRAQPADAHYLRFTQLRAIGRKVSDEFTVPLCRTHHRDNHSFGDEVTWWERRAIDPVATSRMLWVSTRRIE